VLFATCPMGISTNYHELWQRYPKHIGLCLTVRVQAVRALHCPLLTSVGHTLPDCEMLQFLNHRARPLNSVHSALNSVHSACRWARAACR